MTKHLTTHELGKLLLKGENKPIFIEESFEKAHEWFKGYSNITGIDEKVVENGVVFKKEYLSGKPNDNYYNLGDTLVTLLDKESEEYPIPAKDITFMIVTKTSAYIQFIGSIGFYEDESTPNTTYINPEIKVAITEGFHPEWKVMNIEDALEWYKKHLPNIL